MSDNQNIEEVVASKPEEVVASEPEEVVASEVEPTTEEIVKNVQDILTSSNNNDNNQIIMTLNNKIDELEYKINKLILHANDKANVIGHTTHSKELYDMLNIPKN